MTDYAKPPERAPDTDKTVKQRNEEIAEVSHEQGEEWRRAMIEGAAWIYSVAADRGVEAAFFEGLRRFGPDFGAEVKRHG